VDVEITHRLPEGFDRPTEVREFTERDAPAAASASVPYGELEKVEQQPGWGNRVRVVGWAMDDASTTEPSQVLVYTGESSWWITADAHRPDVAHMGTGDNHGFELMVPITQTGENVVCVTIYDRTRSVLGPEMCASFVVADPVGAMNGLTLDGSGGKVTVTGWALDPDTADPVQVRIMDGGQVVATVTADQPMDKEDAARYPAHGANHAFTAEIQASTVPGIHSVTVMAVNRAGSGSDVTVGQQYYISPEDATAPTVTVGALRAREMQVNLNPLGLDVRFESQEVSQGEGGAWVTHGNVANPNTYLYKGLKPDTPYRFRVTAYNYRSSAQPLIFEQRTPKSAAPVGGTYEMATDLSWKGEDKITFSGYAIDPDTADPIQVRILEDDRVISTVTADKPMNENDAARYPGYGTEHGFTVTIPAPANPGLHSYAMVAVKTPETGGQDTLMGQEHFVAPDDVREPKATLSKGVNATEMRVDLDLGENTSWVGFEAMEVPESGDGTWAGHDTVPNTDTYVYKGLKPGVRYRFRVTAYNYRSAAPPVVVEGRTVGTAPAAVSELTVSKVEDQALTVQWKDNSSDEDSFELQVIDLESSATQVKSVPAKAGTWHVNQRVDGLRSLGDYLVTVRPVRENAEEQHPVILQAKTSGPAGINEFTATAISEPSGCTTGFSLSWTVSNTTRIVIKRQTGAETVLLDRQLAPPSPSHLPQTGTFTDDWNNVSAKTYVLIAYDPNGRTTTRSISFAAQNG
jgi:hypothetical protein